MFTINQKSNAALFAAIMLSGTIRLNKKHKAGSTRPGILLSVLERNICRRTTQTKISSKMSKLIIYSSLQILDTHLIHLVILILSAAEEVDYKKNDNWNRCNNPENIWPSCNRIHERKVAQNHHHRQNKTRDFALCS